MKENRCRKLYGVAYRARKASDGDREKLGTWKGRLRDGEGGTSSSAGPISVRAYLRFDGCAGRGLRQIQWRWSPASVQASMQDSLVIRHACRGRLRIGTNERDNLTRVCACEDDCGAVFRLRALERPTEYCRDIDSGSRGYGTRGV